MGIKKICKIILVFIENIKQQKRILNSSTVFILEIYIFFLHKFKGGDGVVEISIEGEAFPKGHI